MKRALVRLGVDVRPEELGLTVLLSSSLFLVIAFQYVSKAIRQSTYVDVHGATSLPWVYLLVAICSYPLLQRYVKWSGRVPRQSFGALTQALVAAGTFFFWWLYGRPWSWVPVVFYVWTAIVFVVLVSQFWSQASQRLDPRQAKRLFGLVGVGGLLGGIAGGQMARVATLLAGTRNSLLVAAGLMVAGAFLTHRLSPSPSGADRPEGGRPGTLKPDLSGGGLRATLAHPHLRLIGLVVVLSVAVAQIVDLQFNWAVERSTSSLTERTALFGNVLSVVSLAALLFQILFTSRIHSSLGVGAAMRFLPSVIGVGTAAMLLASGFFPEMLAISAIALKVGEGGVRFSLDHSTRELLFYPVPSSLRVKAKAFIDVLLLRTAEGVAALLLLPVTFGAITPVQAGWITVVLVIAWLVTAGAAYRTYVGSFRDSLEERTLDAVVPINLADVRTVELLVQSLGSADPRQVLHSLDILDRNGRGHLVPPLLLYHDDAEVRRRTLQVLAGADRRDAVSLVERRLGDDNPEVRAEAIRVLTGFNVGDSSSLMLPRLKESDPKVRAAAVVCLVNHGGETASQQARLALYEMLSDGDPGVRAEALKAIGAIRGSEFASYLLQGLDDPEPLVAREAIHAVRRVVEREGFTPIYLPRLVSLLQNRRLKLDAREALVGFGDDAIPILAHFMRDREESIFVRRSLPKTIARIGGPPATAALLESLVEADDAFLRAQIIEALAMDCEEAHRSGGAPVVEQTLEKEARRYLLHLSDLVTVGGDGGLELEGPLARRDFRGQNLLAQMLAERMEEHVHNMFGLLALLYPPEDVWASYRSLLSGRRILRANALEYLENTLNGSLRRNLFSAIGDVTMEQKLRAAARDFGVELLPLETTVGRILDEGREGDADARALSVAALYFVRTDELSGLEPRVTALRTSTRDSLVKETADWVGSQLEAGARRVAARGDVEGRG